MSKQFLFRQSAGILVFVFSFASAFGTNYYVSPSGSDSNNGTSKSTPWKTIAKVNAAELAPGDTVNFLGGATFTSSVPLTFTAPKDDGSAANPILITSYDGGGSRATISVTGNISAVEGQHVSGYRLSNLIFKGPGWANNTKSGLFFFAWAPGALKYLHIDRVDVSGFGNLGITVQASTAGSSFQDIQVIESNLSGNKFGGFEALGAANGGAPFARTVYDVHLADNKIYDRAAISFVGVWNGVIERCVVANTHGAAPIATAIFICSSSYIQIRDNEGYGIINDGTTGTDDSNFLTLDYGSEHCLVERNYSHDNGGPAIHNCGINKAGLPPTRYNIIRYNISENDCTQFPYGAISCYRGVSDTDIYGNTIYNLKGDGIQIWDWKATSFPPAMNIHVRNNIIMTSSAPTQYPVQVFTPNDTSLKLENLNVVFQGNNYYASGGSFRVHWGEKFYLSLIDWQNATWQERLITGQYVGSTVNPRLTNPGGGGPIDDPSQLVNLNAYQLLPGSTLRRSGLDLLGLFGTDIGLSDFYGNTLPSGRAFSVGAHDP